jgi:DNA-binding GntR family transcriptional regulator
MTLERAEMTGDAIFSGRHDRRKVTDWAYEEIRDAIIGLRLQPGDSLREAALAERLGVSKTPVREALGRLEKEGLVATTSFKGAVVSSYSSRDLIEIYELRELLEGAAARTAAERSSPEAVDRLQGIVQRSRDLRAAGELDALADLLGEFDEVVYAQVENSRIAALIANLRAHLSRIGKLTEQIPGRVEASVEEHAAIVRSIAEHDADEAERLIRTHIRSVLNDQLDAMS